LSELLDVAGTPVESAAMDGAVETIVPNTAAAAIVRKNVNCIGRPSWKQTYRDSGPRCRRDIRTTLRLY